MRTLCKYSEGRTSFVMTDLDPSLIQAAQNLYYLPCPDGFAKTYPSDTPHLEYIYHHFQRDAEEMLLQMAEVHPVPWEAALLAWLKTVGDEPLQWWLGGSAALAVRGIEVVPHDLDLITDGDGAHRLADLLLDRLVEPLQYSRDWIADWFGRAFWHARIEWVGDVVATTDESLVSDFGAAAARRLETVIWQGYEIRVPPLEMQLAVSERRGLKERVAAIARYQARRD